MRRPPAAVIAVIVALAAVIVVIVALAAPSSSQRSNVIVQGTTDVRDAGLLDDVILPGFRKAYPQYNLKYVAVGSGQALTNAEAGQGDAVLTHSPTQERDFVKAGYSAEPSGRAIFYSDYVIVGPKNDPAGVLSAARHNAARAFQLIAAAGKAGKANFVSRGDDSGTNTEEKEIWKLTNVALNSAGEPGSGSRNPSWYHKANAGQGPTVQVADQCPFSHHGCYDITDRGTFNRLLANNAITNLQIVAARNDPRAPGGMNLLVNSFHAYVVNSRKVSSVNVDGANAFLRFLTSPALQARLATYPTAQQPAFVADARPTLKLTSPRLSKTVVAGTRLKIAGTLTGKLPGHSPITGPELTLRASDTPLAVRRLKKSTFSFSVPAEHGGNYQVSFRGSGDLSPSTYSLGNVKVVAK